MIPLHGKKIQKMFIPRQTYDWGTANTKSIKMIGETYTISLKEFLLEMMKKIYIEISLFFITIHLYRSIKILFSILINIYHARRFGVSASDQTEGEQYE